MPMYVIQRKFDVGEAGRPAISSRSRRVIQDRVPEVTWLHSHVTVDDDGKVRTFCIYDAPDEDAIRRHSEVLGYHIVEGIFEIAGDVTPEDFPLTDDPL
jgi:hypothetical protein